MMRISSSLGVTWHPPGICTAQGASGSGGGVSVDTRAVVAEKFHEAYVTAQRGWLMYAGFRRVRLEAFVNALPILHTDDPDLPIVQEVLQILGLPPLQPVVSAAAFPTAPTWIGDLAMDMSALRAWIPQVARVHGERVERFVARSEKILQRVELIAPQLSADVLQKILEQVVADAMAQRFTASMLLVRNAPLRLHLPSAPTLDGPLDDVIARIRAWIDGWPRRVPKEQEYASASLRMLDRITSEFPFEQRQRHLLQLFVANAGATWRYFSHHIMIQRALRNQGVTAVTFADFRAMVTGHRQALAQLSIERPAYIRKHAKAFACFQEQLAIVEVDTLTEGLGDYARRVLRLTAHWSRLPGTKGTSFGL